MTFPFASLPAEILYYGILSKLELNDIANFCECLYLGLPREIYVQFFPHDPPFPTYSTQMFSQRYQAGVYILGRGDSWHNEDHIHFEKVKLSPQLSPFYRLSKPIRAGLSEPVLKVSTSSKPTFILTVSGKAYRTSCNVQTADKDHQNDSECSLMVRTYDMDANNMPIFNRVLYLENVPYANIRHELYNRDSDVIFTPASIDISSDDAPSLFALDNSGTITHFDGGRHLDDSGWREGSAPLPIFVDGRFTETHDGTIIREHILRMHSHSAFFKHRGVAVMEDTTDILVPCLTIPNTETGVKDWALCRECVVCLRTDGSVDFTQWRSNLPPHEVFYDVDLSEKFNALEKLNRFGPFTQISGHGCNLALISSDGDIIVAQLDQEHEFMFPKRHKIPNVVSVAAGENHFLALTSNGDVYSWGEEDLRSGCMGLGTLDEALAKGAKLENKTLKMEKPTKMELPGRAFAISAGSGQSGVIVYDRCTQLWGKYRV